MAPRWGLWITATGILLAGALACDAVFAATGGALPRGDDPPTAEEDTPPAAGAKGAVEAKTDKAAAKKLADHHSCFLDLSEPPGGTGHFTPDGKSLYLLAQVGVSKKDKAAHKKDRDTTKIKYTLLKITPKSHKTESIVSFDHLPNAQLLTLGNPLKSATAIAFSGRSAGCYEGPAATVSLSFDKTTDKAVSTVGQYELVTVPDGRMLVDLKKNIILNIDPITFQAKTARKIPTGERALYFDEGKKQLVTWSEDGDNRGLAAYNGDDDKTPVRLPIKRGDRVVQSGPLFGIVHVDSSKNALDIEEVMAWSGSGETKHYKVVVPPAYPVSTAGIDVNFKRHIALVFGANYAAKLKWQRVFVYDYQGSSLLGTVPVSGNQYVNFAETDAAGTVAIIEVRDATSRQTVVAKIFDVAKKSFDEIDLGLTKVPEDNEIPKD